MGVPQTRRPAPMRPLRQNRTGAGELPVLPGSPSAPLRIRDRGRRRSGESPIPRGPCRPLGTRSARRGSRQLGHPHSVAGGRAQHPDRHPTGRHAISPTGRLPGRPGPSRCRVEPAGLPGDRKSTRLNSSHITISYAVFCLKKKKKKEKKKKKKKKKKKTKIIKKKKKKKKK